MTEIPPAAHEAVSALIAEPATPVKLLVTGGIGTGKSSVLAAARNALRAADIAVITRAPRPDDDSSAAFVIDDVHLLTDDELVSLTERVSDPGATIVVATQPLARRQPLRALTTALERENSVISLGSLTAAEVTEEARFALIERLRRIDEPVLDALLVTSLSPELGADDVAAALHLDSDEAARLVDMARATGLIDPSHSEAFLRSVHVGVATIIGAARHHEVEIALLCSQTELTTLTSDLALRMADHGLRDDRLATALADLAAHDRDQPAEAARLYRAAAEAGATAVNARLADALAMTGDCTTAGRLADELLTSEDPGERAAAVRIAASIAAHDGGMAQAADLFRWLGPYPDAYISAANTVVSIAAGDAQAARSAVGTESAGPPTSTARAAHNLAEGLLMSLDQPFPATIARLGQAITTEAHQPGVAPDSPAALVTLAALHGGDPVRARSVIGRAARADGTDDAFSAYRHRLLLGWVRMQDGALATATADALAAGEATLHRRDALWAAALNTAIARRSGDGGAVQKHWYAAMEVLAEYSVDLFSLLPLGELWVAAARIRQVDRLQHTLDEAFALLDALGNPPLWSIPLHWAGVHAGILANSPDAVAPHGHALTSAAGSSAFAKALAGAGRTWLRVLANNVDVDEVTAAARSLSQFGLTSDATRLAGQAALQTPDGRVSGAMLQLARDLKLTGAVDDSVESTPAATAPAGMARQQASRLSEREREVAELLLLGMPYKLIGEQLFISAKTVEHHVARIRRRLGAESRSEMLSMLRAMLAAPS